MSSDRDEQRAAQSQVRAQPALLEKEIYSEICPHCHQRVSPALMPRLAGYWRRHTLVRDCYVAPLKYCPACRLCMETKDGTPLKIGEK